MNRVHTTGNDILSVQVFNYSSMLNTQWRVMYLLHYVTYTMFAPNDPDSGFSYISY